VNAEFSRGRGQNSLQFDAALALPDAERAAVVVDAGGFDSAPLHAFTTLLASAAAAGPGRATMRRALQEGQTPPCGPPTHGAAAGKAAEFVPIGRGGEFPAPSAGNAASGGCLTTAVADCRR
jgi:hypothetical protein